MSTALLETLTDPVEGLAGPDFYAYFLDQKNVFEFNDQYNIDTLRILIDTYVGRGVMWQSYTPPLITAGTGLTVNIGLHKSIIQQAVILTGTTVWAIPDNSTWYLWELFTNTDATPQYALTADTTDPSTDDVPAHILATITTLAGAVTNVTEMFNIIYRPADTKSPLTETYGPLQSSPYQKVWDADNYLRTGGTVSASVDVQQNVDATKSITIQRGTGEDVTLAPVRAWTFTAPRTFNIVDGMRPVNNTTDTPNIQEDLIISYTPL